MTRRQRGGHLALEQPILQAGSELVGRLAPSPTGAQHLGNARTYLLAWLSIRSRGGHVILRIEDIDSPRVKPWAVQQAIDDLRWLGLDWDAGPDVGGARGPYVQTWRISRYAEILQQLRELDLVYPCTCTRSDIQAAASAPHQDQEGPVYPGTCASKSSQQIDGNSNRLFAWRFRSPAGTKTFSDRIVGERTVHFARELGDFVVYKSDGSPAYQLAVVVDDHDMNVTEVLRGDDLIASTFRQIAIYDALGWSHPVFAHVPLVIGTDGRRLAKRHGDTRLSTWKEQGVDPQSLVGFLAWSCGLLETPTRVTPRELLARFDLTKLPREPLVLSDELVRLWLKPVGT